jgi:glycine betaine/proline transport system permease protein
MEWLTEFPDLGTSTLRNIRLTVDGAFRDFTRAYGESIELLFEPVKWFLINSENFMTDMPWPLILGIVAVLVWMASRSWKITLSSIVVLIVIGLFGMWEDTMKTIAMTFVATVLAILFGIPIGIGMSRSNRVQSVVNPILDIMQTMPSFVYLIPVIMLFGIGKVPGLIAVIIYAIPPIIRLTNLGIRLVDKDVLEAADAFGSSSWQRLKNVQMPLALPTIMAGINQTIMMALAMVVVASMVGVQGLGQQVLRAINNQYFTLGVLNGLAIVGVAIIFDRASQAYGQRLQRHTEVVHG